MVGQKAKINDTIDIEKFIFTTYSKLVNVNRNYLNIHLMVVYGNYLKPYKEVPSKYDHMESIDNLMHYIVKMKTQFKKYFTESDAKKLEDMVFVNCCDMLSDRFVWYELNLKMFNKIPATKKGLIGMLLYEKEFMEEYRIKSLRYPEFLKESEIMLGVLPLLVDYMSENYIRYRVMRYAVMESLIDLLFRIIENSMNKRIEEIVAVFNQVSLVIVFFVVPASIAASCSVNASYCGDLKIAFESFRNIDADLLYHHPVIKRAFLRYHSRKL